MLSIQSLLGGILCPATNFSRVELFETMKTGTARRNKNRSTSDEGRCNTEINASCNIEIWRGCIYGDLVESVSGPIMVEATDDEVDVSKFGVGWKGGDLSAGSTSRRRRRVTKFLGAPMSAIAAVTSRLRLEVSTESLSSNSNSPTPR